MPKKRRNISKHKGRLPGDDTTDAPPPRRRTEIRVGNISDINGSVSIAGGDIALHHTTASLSVADIKQLFDGIYANIDARPEISSADQEDIKAEVKEIQSTLTEAMQKNQEMDEGFLSRRFRSIARIAPDVLDVLVATLANPLAGLRIAAKKIAEKAKLESQLPGDSTTDAPPPKK